MALLVGSVFSKQTDLSGLLPAELSHPSFYDFKKTPEKLNPGLPSPPPFCHHCVLVLENNQGPLLGKGFLFARNGTGHFSAFSASPPSSMPCSPKLHRQSPQDSGGKLRGAADLPLPDSCCLNPALTVKSKVGPREAVNTVQ